MKRILIILLTVSALICLLSAASAEEAALITEGITFEANSRSQDFDLMFDDDFRTYYPMREKKGWLEIHSEVPVYGVYLMQFEKITVPLSYDLEVKGADGEWIKISEGGQYLIHWHPLEEGTTDLRIRETSQERVRIAELRLYGKGDKPREVQDWKTLDKCDMMLLTAHPDDELLWFAGLLPTYAGERRLRVQLAVLSPTGGERKLELLHAIWHCGVTAYPEFIGLVDKNGHSVEGQYEAWKGKGRVLGLVTEVIRKYKPEVMVTHAEKGEYGHGAHKVACAASKDCFKLAAKENQYTKSVKQYGTWQIKKLYIHEYKKNVIPCDWNVPLEAFGGKTGYQVAEEAFQFHRSQVRRNWSFDEGLEHDNSLFGLFYTKVGQDTGIGDFMEHITLEDQEEEP